MALMNWDSTLQFDIAEIDNQHKKLVELLNTLFDAMQDGRSREVLGKILNELASYTVMHFKNEEKYFEKFGFEDEVDHIAAHESFVSKVSKFKAEFDSGNATISQDLLRYLKDWITKHINVSDRKYVELFKKNGL